MKTKDTDQEKKSKGEKEQELIKYVANLPPSFFKNRIEEGYLQFIRLYQKLYVERFGLEDKHLEDFINPAIEAQIMAIRSTAFTYLINDEEIIKNEFSRLLKAKIPRVTRPRYIGTEASIEYLIAYATARPPKLDFYDDLDIHNSWKFMFRMTGFLKDIVAELFRTSINTRNRRNDPKSLKTKTNDYSLTILWDGQPMMKLSHELVDKFGADLILRKLLRFFLKNAKKDIKDPKWNKEKLQEILKKVKIVGDAKSENQS